MRILKKSKKFFVLVTALGILSYCCSAVIGTPNKPAELPLENIELSPPEMSTADMQDDVQELQEQHMEMRRDLALIRLVVVSQSEPTPSTP